MCYFLYKLFQKNAGLFNMKNNKTEFLSYLQRKRMTVFSLAQVKDYFDQLSKADYEFIENLARTGSLTKLKRGLYARNPYPGTDQTYMPNWHKVAEALIYPKEYYIGFYSALQIHDLITQPALREYVVTKEQVVPKVQQILSVPFEMIYSKEERFFGVKKTWINDHDKVYCSDIEKTIIDCLYMPQHAGGLEGIVKAIDKAKDKLRPSVLVEYVIRFKVQAVMKRLGYVLDHLDLYPTERNILSELITDAYTKLDPSLDLKGKFHRKWRIEDNVDLKDIIQTIDT